MFNRISIIALGALFTLGLSGPIAVHAASSPSLGTAASFSILAGSTVTNVPTSSIAGNVGLSPAAGSYYDAGVTAAQVTGTIYAVDATGPAGSVVNPGALTTAKNDLSAAYDALAVDACGNEPDHTTGGDGSGGSVDGTNWTGEGVIDLAGRTLVPGIYCASAFTLTGVLTLSGGASDVYIFRSAADIITSPGSSVTGGGACNVWWRAVSSVTLDTTTDFTGNILALTSITMNTGATLDGRALARNGAVTLDHNTITGATCLSGGALYGTLRVTKTVTNDVDGTSVAADFNLYVKLSGSNVAGSPAVGIASPGRTYLLAAGTYVVSEDEDSAYNQSFSGACNSSGSVTLVNGETKTCTITNNDISPTIKVTKEASKTTLEGPDDVTFTYKVTNRGDVALSDVSVKDDKCDSVKYASGDDNNDDLLDTNEEWIYRCTDKIEKTETNTVTALGTANGERVKDTDTAKVTVSTPGLPATGVGPADESSTSWNSILPISIFAILFSFYLARKKTGNVVEA